VEVEVIAREAGCRALAALAVLFFGRRIAGRRGSAMVKDLE
jgi:hypothetical protein